MASLVCFLAILLSPLAMAGLAFMNTGLSRSRNAAHMMLASLCVIALAGLTFLAIGFSWQGYEGSPSYALMAGGRSWNWIASLPFFLRGMPLDISKPALAALFGMMSAGLAAMIPLGSAADRWKLGSICLSTAILTGWTYPLFAHWAWGGGWLAGLGFIDAGGSGVIHAVGGLSALGMTWVLGPRRGKFTPDRMPLAIPGHNSVYVLFGCLLAWAGFIGLNTAGAILNAGADVEAAVRVALNVSLSAVGSVLAVAALTRIRYSKPDASLCANGWIAGLVAGSAGCAFLAPGVAALVGIIAGAVITYSVEWLELHLNIDDPGGAISVHGLAGLWGLLATGWFAPAAHWIPQAAGISTLIGCVFPMTYAIHWLLNRIHPMRVPPEGERLGLDMYELGSGAYPDFITHNDDLQR
jgi:Amt family ammonium transporter